MHRTAEDAAEDDPKEHDRSEKRPGDRAEDGAGAGDVQQFDEEGLTLAHRGDVHAVGIGQSGRLATVDGKDLFADAAVDEITADQKREGDEERNHGPNYRPLLLEDSRGYGYGRILPR